MDASRLLPLSTLYAAVVFAPAAGVAFGWDLAGQVVLAGLWTAGLVAHGAQSARQTFDAMVHGRPAAARAALLRRRGVLVVGGLGMFMTLGASGAAVGALIWSLAVLVVAFVGWWQSAVIAAPCWEQAC